MESNFPQQGADTFSPQYDHIQSRKAASMIITPQHLIKVNETEVEICIELPPQVNSIGIWKNMSSPYEILTYSLPLLESQTLLIFFVTQLVHAILKPFGITLFASQMFAGIILSPLMLGKQEAFIDLFLKANEFSIKFLDTAAVFGCSIFLFLMAVKVDVGVAFRTTRRVVVVGILSLVSPFVVGLVVYEVFNKKSNQSNQQQRMERLIVNNVQCLTSFPVVACLLGELKITNSELGRMALSSAIVNDLCHYLLVYGVSLFSRWNESPSLAMRDMGMIISFIFVVFFVFRPWMFWVIRTTPEGKPIHETYISVIVMGAIGSSLFTHWFHSSPLYGAFLFGLAVPDGPPLGSALIDKFECFVNGAFLTLYVTTVTMSIDSKEIFSDPSRLQFSLTFIILTFLAKLVPSFSASFLSKMTLRDSLAFALIMSSKGIVDLTYFNVLKDLKAISESSFSIMAYSILLNATLIPILVKFLYDPVSRKYACYKKRNLKDLKSGAELRILACIHTSENVPTLIHLLDHTSPTVASPIVIYALHLIDLVGRDSPVFIAHQKQENGVDSSFKHILAFNQYEQNNRGLVTVNTFTVISPPKLKYEDISIMALDKQTSFIILPFHRKLSMDGSLDFDNNAIRNLNCTVLDRAPCSVGILLDRGMQDFRSKALKSSPYSICMLFLGGKDDREALTLAKRMAYDPRVKLTLIRIITDQHCTNVMDWDMILDAEMLKDIKQNEVDNGCDILYMEEVSNSGRQAATIVRSVANDYDLIIVGRRYGVDSIQTTGLSEWSEFPELGVVGDLLASTDLDTRTSVLVVQRQSHIDVDRH